MADIAFNFRSGREDLPICLEFTAREKRNGVGGRKREREKKRIHSNRWREMRVCVYMCRYVRERGMRRICMCLCV